MAYHGSNFSLFLQNLNNLALVGGFNTRKQASAGNGTLLLGG
jgi:hypothetical protein